MSEALLHTLSLLRELQKERSIALLPRYQLDQEQIESFNEQAKASHEVLTQTQKKNSDFWALLPERFFQAYALRNNESFRTSLSPDALIEWYIFNLEQPIHQLALSHITNDPYFSPSQTSALIHFIASLNYLTHLRDLGLSVYIKAEITPTDSSRLKNAASSYLAREKLYLGLADDTLRSMIDDSTLTSAATLAQMDELLRKIKSGYGKGVLASTSIHSWMELFNLEITALHKAMATSIQKLVEQGRELAAHNNLGQTLDSDVEHHMAAISSLPLFRGLSEGLLRNLLKGARLMDIERNSTIAAQGEPITKLYIVLDGWAKTTKESAEGQEAIFQLLAKKEALFDINCLNASISSLNVKAVTKCRILALSLPILRDHVSRNQKLAQNILTATTWRLQRLVSQYEQMTLKNAIQRVGWFLVNLHLETGLEGKPLKLPFDKALIAAYLNIKPETFSRTLQHFKKNGFVIEKDQVIMPEPYALCDYCDPEMAIRCCRAETANCAPIQLLKRSEGKQ